MNKIFEHFNVEMIFDYQSIATIIEKVSANIFFVGHRFENDVSVDGLIDSCGCNVSLQYKDCIVGEVPKDKLDFIAQYLKDNFISGYIIWFSSDVKFSIFDFGKLFFENKKTCLLTSIYFANVAGVNYVINVPEELEGKVMGMIFTEFGESSFTLIYK